MTTLEQFESKFAELQSRFKTAREDDILFLQKEYSDLFDEFRSWAKENPTTVSVDNRANLIQEGSFRVGVVDGKVKIIP